ncbi:MAG: glycosyltransferase 87 family protein [Candidatus Dormibacteraeota bacterium]|nr:glycosyltransferase 87 family protein [Candidatus Dormibacteraeota bacterium]
MSRPRLPAAVVATAALVLLAAYVALWSGVSATNIGTSDFTATYVGATLLREGHGAAMYDHALQAPLHAALIAPLQRGNLPYVNPPVAAGIVVPLTLLPLATAYRIWQAIQLLMLGAAIVVALRAAPWPARLPHPGVRLAIALAALAGTGTLSLGLLAQWDGFTALGLAGAYALWHRNRGFAGGALLAASAAMAKPHLATGLAALLLGWRERRVLAGAATGLAAAVLASLIAAGPAALSGFVGAGVADATRWPLASLLGFTGLTGSWLGNGTAAHVLAAAGSLAAVTACIGLGRRVARDRSALEPCLAAATVLSLLASPHLLSHDMVLLAPVLVWMTAWAAGQDGVAAWPGRHGRAVLAGWVVLSLTTAVDLGADQAAPPGRLVPWALLALAGVLIWQLGPRRRSVVVAPT